MKVVEFLRQEAVIADLRSSRKADVIQELAAAVASADGASPDEVARVLLAREKLGSTGIGDGVAIPHGTLPSLKRLTAAFGRSRQGVAFDAIDGRPTHLFFVLLTPESAVGLQALARVSRLMRDADFREKLMSAGSAADIYAVLKDGDDRS